MPYDGGHGEHQAGGAEAERGPHHDVAYLIGPGARATVRAGVRTPAVALAFRQLATQPVDLRGFLFTARALRGRVRGGFRLLARWNTRAGLDGVVGSWHLKASQVLDALNKRNRGILA